MADLTAELEPTFDALIRAWTSGDLQSIRSLWHAETDEPWYVAEEEPDPLAGWDAIEDYWRRTSESITRLTMRIWDLQAKPVGADHALVLYQMHWNAEVQGMPKPCGGDNRVTALLRRSDESPRWRFCHYVEAPLAPIVYLRRYYEASVDPEFIA